MTLRTCLCLLIQRLNQYPWSTSIYSQSINLILLSHESCSHKILILILQNNLASLFLTHHNHRVCFLTCILFSLGCSEFILKLHLRFIDVRCLWQKVFLPLVYKTHKMAFNIIFLYDLSTKTVTHFTTTLYSSWNLKKFFELKLRFIKGYD